MTDPGYPAARSIAPRLRDHFAHYLERTAANPEPGDALLAPPIADDIEAIVDAAFWASLKREEGYIPKISLALIAPDAIASAMRFATPLPLKPASLVKVAPAVERAGIHLGVWREEGELRVWGTTRSIPRVRLRPRGSMTRRPC